jgi:DNA polymerase-3 subunit beta
MKFSVPNSELQKALLKVGGVIPSKSTLPILENILFALSKNTLTITATDLEISMTVTLEVRGLEDGKIAVPARRLTETARALPDVTVNFQADTSSNKIVMRTEIGEYKLTGEPSEEFPSVPEFESEDEITIESEDLRRTINKTLFAVSTDELRPSMMGILFQIKKNELRAVSTDGHRLVRLVKKDFSSPKTQRDLVIPSKALNLVAKSTEEVQNKIALNNSHVMVRFGFTTLISRLIDENYPNYETVIPTENDKELTVGRDLLLSSVRRVALYSSTTTRQVRFTLAETEMKISAEDVDFGGEATETLPCTFRGEPMEIGFNAHYILDVLTHIDSDEVVFKLSTPTRAGIVQPATQREHEDLLMLVMPVRLNI